MPRIITLLTDFGAQDTYVGVMKGVILGIAPQASIVDLTHEVAPQDVRAAAFHLAAAIPYFPPGTIHVAVVDPGVGSARRAIAMETARAVYVGPDNGLLPLAAKGEKTTRVVHLENPRYRLPVTSATFHGRDVFAPAAAHLAAGVDLAALGPEIADPLCLPSRSPTTDDAGWSRGEVQHVDRFGNLITNIEAASLAGATRVVVGDYAIEGISTTYAAAGKGEILALAGSHGYLEIAMRDGSAAEYLGAGVGTAVAAGPPR